MKPPTSSKEQSRKKSKSSSPEKSISSPLTKQMYKGFYGEGTQFMCFREPVEYIKRSLQQLVKTKCPVEKFSILHRVTEAKTASGDYRGAIKTSFRTESIATSINDELLYGKSLFSRALSLLWFGKIGKATEILQKCLHIGEMNHSMDLTAKCLLVLARIDMIKGYEERCKVHLDKSMELAGQLGNLDLTLAGKLLQCELLISTGRKEEAIETGEKAISGGEETIGPLHNEIRTLLGSLYLNEGKIMKSLNVLSFHRQFSSHSLGWGLNASLRLACVHLQTNHPKESATIIGKINKKMLPLHEQILMVRIEMKAARTCNNHTKLVSLLKEDSALRLRAAKAIVDYGNLHAALLAVEKEPIHSKLVGNSGEGLLTKEESLNVNPTNYSLFYNSLTGKIYKEGKLITSISPRGKKGQLLTLLMKHSSKSYNHKEIFEKIWKERFNHEFNDNNVYVTISKLRKAIDDSKGSERWQLLKSPGVSTYSFNPTSGFKWAILTPTQE